LVIKTPAAASKCCKRYLGDPTTAEKAHTLQQTLQQMLHKNTAQTQPTKGRIERGVSHAMLLKVVESLWAYQNAYCSCDIDAVHGWLIHVQEMLWSLVHP